MGKGSQPSYKNPRFGLFASRAFFIFSLFWCWEAVLLYVPSIHNDGIGTSLLWNTTNYGSLAICIFIVIANRYFQRLIGTKHFKIFLVALLELGTLITIAVSFFAGSQLEVWQYALCILGGFVLSAGIMLTDLVLVCLLMDYPSEANRGAIVVGAMAAHLLIYLLVDNLPPFAIVVCVVALPCIVGVLLGAGKSGQGIYHLPLPSESIDSAPQSKASSDHGGHPAKKLLIPLKFLVVIFVLGLSINFIRNAILAQAGNGVSFSNSSVIALTLMVFLIAAAIETFHKARRNNTIIPLAIVIVVTAAIVVNQAFAGFQEIALALTFAGFFLYVTVFYRTAADYAILDKTDLVKTTIVVFLANSFGLSVGSILWITSNSFFGDAAQTISFILIYLIFIGGVLLFFWAQMQTMRNLLVDDNARKKPDKPHQTPLETANGSQSVSPVTLTELLQQDCDLLAQGKNLTQRETETLYLLARRRNYLQIADTMHVSGNTAKSHIRHVYQKLGIHSAEELFESLEAIDEDRALRDGAE